MRDAASELPERVHLLRLAEPLLDLTALGLRDREGHQSSDRDREAELVRRPHARCADVLVTQHSVDLPVDLDRRIEHRDDPQRPQVGVRELAGADVRHGVIGRKDLAGRDRTKVPWKVGGRELQASRVLGGRRLEQIVTRDRGPALVEPPYADALDAEDPRRALRDLAQRDP